MAHSMMSNAGGAASLNDGGLSSNTPNAVPLERRCDNPECTVYKMVSNVPKRKTPQFVTEPVVMEKPLLINGFTTIFQIEGQSAKLSDIKASEKQRPLYRIVPNTHAHIVNYVVVDSDAESLRKINENDPATMRKLLDSQKQSADQMLKKLIAGHSLPLSTVNGTSSLGTGGTTNTNSNGTNNSAGGVGGGVIGSITPISVAKLMPQSTPAIQLPTRVHPNLKITAVASAEGLSTNSASTSVQSAASQLPIQQQQQQQQSTQQTMPLITPIPLANLQRAPATSSTHVPSPMSSNISMGASLAPMGGVGTPFGDVVEKTYIDKMQQELQELRRTVAYLAEAQAKNNPQLM